MGLDYDEYDCGKTQGLALACEYGEIYRVVLVYQSDCLCTRLDKHKVNRERGSLARMMIRRCW